MSLYAEKSQRKFYDAWEFLPEEKRRILIAEKLEAYLAYASTLPFYRDRLSGVDMKKDFPLAKIPLLTSQDLRDNLPPTNYNLVAGGNRDFTVFQSGGTTGTPKTTLFSHRELEGLNQPNARGFFAVGLEPTDRVANLFAVGGLYMTFIHINRMLQQYGCMNFPFSNQTPVEFVHTVTKLFNVNCFTGIASVVLNAIRGFSQYGKAGIEIEKIYYGGEHFYEADKKELREAFNCKIIAAPGYGTVDTWYLGYQCLDTPTGVFHAHDDEAYIEIVDEDSSLHCEPGKVGMLYATAYPRKLTPIVRYRVGDRATWLKESCPCGRTTPLFQLLGRGDDVLRIGYDSIDYNAIQDCVLKLSGLTGSVQMEKGRKQGKDTLTIRVESDIDPTEYPGKVTQLEKLILESRPSFSDFVKKGTVWPLIVELVPTGTLPRNSRTGKLMRVVDFHESNGVE